VREGGKHGADLSFKAIHFVHVNSFMVATVEMEMLWVQALVCKQQQNHLREQHTSAYVSIRQHTSATWRWFGYRHLYANNSTIALETRERGL
jgi:type IV secretory pathway VirB3-like protein